MRPIPAPYPKVRILPSTPKRVSGSQGGFARASCGDSFCRRHLGADCISGATLGLFRPDPARVDREGLECSDLSPLTKGDEEGVLYGVSLAALVLSSLEETTAGDAGAILSAGGFCHVTVSTHDRARCWRDRPMRASTRRRATITAVWCHVRLRRPRVCRQRCLRRAPRRVSSSAAHGARRPGWLRYAKRDAATEPSVAVVRETI